MNPQDPLANLHPLREPPPIGWWPPAPGWWLLAALALVMLLVLVFMLWRRYRANAYRRAALKQLQHLQQVHDQHSDDLQFITQTNALLKSVALVAYPRREVAASSGQQWLAFLNSKLVKARPFPEAFVSAAYCKDTPDVSVGQLYLTAQAWIKQHKVAA